MRVSITDDAGAVLASAALSDDEIGSLCSPTFHGWVYEEHLLHALAERAVDELYTALRRHARAAAGKRVDDERAADEAAD
jgi:hypothetical protein